MNTRTTITLIGVLLLGIFGLLFFLNSNTFGRGVAVGDTAINIKFMTTDGSTFDLASQRGKVVIVDFITTNCPICVEEFEVLRQLVNDDRVVIVSVNVDDASFLNLQSFATYYDVGWILGGSSQAGTDYKVTGVPTLLVIDKSGIIRYRGYYTDLGQLNQSISRYV